jgi:hypothetical protein
LLWKLPAVALFSVQVPRSRGSTAPALKPPSGPDYEYSNSLLRIMM